MISVGQTVAMWRKARGMSQEELARRAGMQRPNLSVIERGRRTAEVAWVQLRSKLPPGDLESLIQRVIDRQAGIA